MPGIKLADAFEAAVKEEMAHLADIKKPLASRAKVTEKLVNGAITTGFYRGKQAGWHECFKLLWSKHPAAASAILKHFNMDKEGTVTIGVRRKSK